MENSSIVLAMCIATVVMFVFPLIAMSDTSDNLSQVAAQANTIEFKDEIMTTGVLSLSNYENFVSKLNATGNTYSVDLEFQILDENLSKKTTQAESTKIGENEYYTLYTTQILDSLTPENPEYKLKEGDIVTVTVKNTNKTLSTILKSAFYRITGNDSYQILASSSGMVTVNGK